MNIKQEIKEEIKNIVSKLSNLKFTKDDQISFLNSTIDALTVQLQRKEKECEELKIKLLQQNDVNTFFNTPIPGWDNDPCGICECKHEYPKYKQALGEIEKLTTIGEVYGLSDIQYVENFRLHQERISGIINKVKENK